MGYIKMSENEAKAYLDDLEKRIMKKWDATVEETQFMKDLVAGTLPMAAIQEFYRNWGKFVPVINSVYMAQFYNHLYFFVSNVDLMEHYVDKVLDEFGHPAPPGHIKILISAGEGLGIGQKDLLETEMNPTARALADFHRTLVNNGHFHEYWLSAMWEGAFGYTCLKWFKALTTHYGLSEEQADYFNKHYEADTQDHLGREAHSSVTKHVLARLLTQGITERPGYSVEYCALTPPLLYAQMLNSAYEAAH